jgi:hypothetical protein
MGRPFGQRSVLFQPKSDAEYAKDGEVGPMELEKTWEEDPPNQKRREAQDANRSKCQTSLIPF